jgi:hypothetical protein
MAQSEHAADNANLPFNDVTEEQLEELAELEGDKILRALVWEDSVADAIDDPDGAVTGTAFCDIDLYLNSGVYFELFATLCYPTLDSPPLEGRSQVELTLNRHISADLWLHEVAVDEEDSLVLVLGKQHKPELYLVVGAWQLQDWDELPELS